MTQVTLTDSERQVQPYDFQRRDALERARLRLLQPILEVLTHRIAGSLTSMLRTPVKVGIGELEQQRWEEYVNSLPEPTFLTGATVVPTGGRIILHLPLPLAMTLIEIRLGGTGGTAIPERSLTEIEQRLVTEVAHGVLAELPPAFSPAMGISMGAISSVSSGMFLPGSTPSEMCLLVGLHVELNESVTEVASICMPLVVLLPILDAIERLDKTEIAEESGVAPTRLREKLHETDVEIRVHWPEVLLSPDELLSLVPGDVVPLHRARDLPIVLSVGGSPYCDVVPTSRGKSIACMVIEQ
ncbi:MAG TPA: FliM/FliN family flagellar motor switch protein [Acidimicrobiales bacterium]|nr:FliM/FliN family flagellar motor switch protein [Acidimicrobiales bacterium]